MLMLRAFSWLQHCISSCVFSQSERIQNGPEERKSERTGSAFGYSAVLPSSESMWRITPYCGLAAVEFTSKSTPRVTIRLIVTSKRKTVKAAHFLVFLELCRQIPSQKNALMTKSFHGLINKACYIPVTTSPNEMASPPHQS